MSDQTSDFIPIETIAGDRNKGLLLICDHARSDMPAMYNQLGLDPAQMKRHIAYDIGARNVTLDLARQLKVPAVLSCFSRLLIDPNRGIDDPTLVMRLSDGALIEGNARIDQAEIAYRQREFYNPYHQRIAEELDAIESARGGKAASILSIHSFTPLWRGKKRPWEISILWDCDPRLPKPLLEALGMDPKLTVGENVPYDGALKNDCLYQHGTMKGRAHALVELRQDLIAMQSGAHAWAERLAPLVEKQLANPRMEEHSFYQSRTSKGCLS